MAEKRTRTKYRHEGINDKKMEKEICENNEPLGDKIGANRTGQGQDNAKETEEMSP